MSDVQLQDGRPNALLRVTTFARLLLVICGAIAVILGLLLWVGIAYPLLPLHMLVGIGVTVALAILAIIGWSTGVNRGLVALAFVWAIVLAALGYTQTRLLLGSFHWIIEVVHLLIGIGAIGLGQVLAARIKQVVNV